MSKYYLVGSNPFNDGRVTVLKDNKGGTQYFDSFLDACKAANELNEMEVMGGIKVVKIKPWDANGVKFFIVGLDTATRKLVVLSDAGGDVVIFNSVEDAQEAANTVENEGTLSYVDIHNVDGCRSL